MQHKHASKYDDYIVDSDEVDNQRNRAISNGISSNGTRDNISNGSLANSDGLTISHARSKSAPDNLRYDP